MDWDQEGSKKAPLSGTESPEELNSFQAPTTSTKPREIDFKKIFAAIIFAAAFYVIGYLILWPTLGDTVRIY